MCPSCSTAVSTSTTRRIGADDDDGRGSDECAARQRPTAILASLSEASEALAPTHRGIPGKPALAAAISGGWGMKLQKDRERLERHGREKEGEREIHSPLGGRAWQSWEKKKRDSTVARGQLLACWVPDT